MPPKLVVVWTEGSWSSACVEASFHSAIECRGQADQERGVELLKDADPERAHRAREAIMKFNIAEVERAAAGV